MHRYAAYARPNLRENIDIRATTRLRRDYTQRKSGTLERRDGGSTVGNATSRRLQSDSVESDWQHRMHRYAASVSLASVGSPSSIGSDGSRDHSFQEPKYIRTSFTPAFFSARNVFDARAPLKQ